MKFMSDLQPGEQAPEREEAPPPCRAGSPSIDVVGGARARALSDSQRARSSRG